MGRSLIDPGRVLRSARWWQRPLPAWGQAAAAALIFAAGLSAGSLRSGTAPPSASASASASLSAAPAAAQREVPAADTVEATALGATAQPSALVATAPAPGASVSADDLARLERDLRGELTRVTALARSAAAARAAAPAASEQAVLVARVEELIAASEQRQRAELILVAEAVGKLDAQRRYDLRRVDGLQGLATETRQNSQALRTLLSAVISGPSTPVARPAGGR